MVEYGGFCGAIRWCDTVVRYGGAIRWCNRVVEYEIKNVSISSYGTPDIFISDSKFK